MIAIWVVCSAVVVDPADVTVVPLQQGVEAPFAGLLVSEEHFIELLEAQTRARELEVKLKISEHTTNAIEEIYRQKLDQANIVAWYDSPTFNRWLGIVLGGALTAVAIWSVSEIEHQTQ